jgi:DHA1 family inner membrane transport protein
LAIAAGYGWTSTGWVGCLLALAGFVIWIVAVATERQGGMRAKRSAALCAEEAR